MKIFFYHKAVYVGLISAGLMLINTAEAADVADADVSNLVLPGSLQVANNLVAGVTVSAPTLKGSLSGKVNYTISPPVTVIKKNKHVTDSLSLGVSMSEGFCFLSGWNSKGHAESSGYVTYDATLNSWKVTVGGHDDVTATATCLLWVTS